MKACEVELLFDSGERLVIYAQPGARMTGTPDNPKLEMINLGHPRYAALAYFNWPDVAAITLQDVELPE